MGATYEYTATLTIVECAGCNMDFGVTPRFEEDRRRDHKTFYCPSGHKNFWPQRSDLQAAKDRAALLASQLDQERSHANTLQRRLSAQKGATTKARKRHAAGVCPCCHRTFKQVREHMARMHPDYTPEG